MIIRQRPLIGVYPRAASSSPTAAASFFGPVGLWFANLKFGQAAAAPQLIRIDDEFASSHIFPTPVRLAIWCFETPALPYNLGKRSVVLDLDSPAGQGELKRLLESADIVVDSRPRGYFAERGLDYDSLKAVNPRLIWAGITPFGDDGPWADYGPGRDGACAVRSPCQRGRTGIS